jgi:hypothetical protein
MASYVKLGIGALFVLWLLAFGVGDSWAGILCFRCTIRIDDLTDTVTVIQFPSFPPVGAPTPVTLLPDSGGEFVHFLLFTGVQTTASSVIYADLFEDTIGGTLSDRLLVTITQGNPFIDVKFASDPANITAPAGISPILSLVEDGTFQTLITTAFPAGFENYVFQVRSDFGDRSDVPEPATLVLLGSGLAGLAGIAWRRRRQ